MPLKLCSLKSFLDFALSLYNSKRSVKLWTDSLISNADVWVASERKKSPRQGCTDNCQLGVPRVLKAMRGADVFDHDGNGVWHPLIVYHSYSWASMCLSSLDQELRPAAGCSAAETRRSCVGIRTPTCRLEISGFGGLLQNQHPGQQHNAPGTLLCNPEFPSDWPCLNFIIHITQKCYLKCAIQYFPHRKEKTCEKDQKHQCLILFLSLWK